jgi:4-diphosphocytidyl-2-C-methyl-D-erythritol kinase
MRRAGSLKVTVRAYAKLNLGLRVLCKRPDNYHELRTVFQTISLADNLEIFFAPGKSTTIVMEGTPGIPDNLAERAARMVMDAAEKTGSVRLNLKKNIPTGAGLGGGSSDAAAVLLALPVMVGAKLPMDRLCDLATRLGSDVPFFLYGGTALGLGRGEELYPLPDQPAKQVLVVAPAIHSSTADAYRDLSASLTKVALQNKLSTFRQGVWGSGSQSNKSSLVNDFESVVFARYPDLGVISDRLRRAGASRVAMTGSGSAVFGIFENPGKLERARLSWEKQADTSGERVFSVSFVSRTRYQSAWRRALASFVTGADRKDNDTWPPQSRHAR